MMKQVLVIHLGGGDESTTRTFLDQEVQIRRIGCAGDAEEARALIAAYDGKADAIGLEGLPAQLELGAARRPHELGAALPQAARVTPVVDGSGIRPGLERWGVTLADRAQPGIFSEKRVLMVPGLNHGGLAHGLLRQSSTIRYADPVIYFGLPQVPGVGSRQSLEEAAGPTLEQLCDEPFRRLLPQPGTPGRVRSPAPFRWADVLAGDVGAIRRYAPERLPQKTVVVEWGSEEDLDDLRGRGVSIAITLMPSLDAGAGLGQWSAATIEALLAALRRHPEASLTEDTYLDLLADLEWQPAVRYLQPEESGINRFAFVIHPLSVDFISRHQWLRWTRFLPDPLVEAVAAYAPPLYLSRVTGARSPATGQRVEGHLIALGATPRQMMSHGERFTYSRLNRAARMAERLGARIMGLGAFTSVVGDAGVTVAHESDIAITSGNSLTVAATLEAAKQAVVMMGHTDLAKGKAMVIGATGSIASVCARLLAKAIGDVVLVSIEPEKLIDLKRTIQAETPGAHVIIATKADDFVGDCDLIASATSAFGQRVLDITRCKPGAVICDIARPPDIDEAEAALRPDVLVIEAGEVLIPGDVDFGFDIDLPPKTAYACLAETVLLAMEGRFEDYTLGRNITMEQVKEIYHLFKKHEFQLGGLRSFARYVTDDDVAKKRALAEGLRRDPNRFLRMQAEAAQTLVKIPPRSKGVLGPNQRPRGRRLVAAVVGASAIAAWVLARRRQRGEGSRPGVHGLAP